jgi:membrane-associated phospholipid phosphatase
VLVIPALVAYSRVYVGVHYPADVLGGALLGAGVGWFFTLLEQVARLRVERFFVRRRRRKEGDSGEV